MMKIGTTGVKGSEGGTELQVLKEPEVLWVTKQLIQKLRWNGQMSGKQDRAHQKDTEPETPLSPGDTEFLVRQLPRNQPPGQTASLSHSKTRSERRAQGTPPSSYPTSTESFRGTPFTVAEKMWNTKAYSSTGFLCWLRVKTNLTKILGFLSFLFSFPFFFFHYVTWKKKSLWNNIGNMISTLN